MRSKLHCRYGFNTLEVYFIRLGELQASVMDFVDVIRLNSKQKVKKTELVSLNGSLEHIEIHSFYKSLREKLQEKSPQMEPELKSFIEGKYFFNPLRIS